MKNQTKISELHEGKETTKQESQNKMKTNTITRMESKNRPGKGKPTAESEENETAILCWENVKDSPGKEPHVESENKGEKPIEKTQKPKDEEEHVNPTLHRGNQLKISIKEFSWETEDIGSILDTQETEQQQLVYIMNLEGGLQKDSMKLYEEEGPNNKKPAAINRFFEEPTLNNLSHIYELYKEFGSDDKNIEEIGKGENKKNAKESSYTNIDKCKTGEQANLLKDENQETITKSQEKWKNEKALVTKEMALSNLGKNIFIPLLTPLIDPNWINSKLMIALVKNF